MLIGERLQRWVLLQRQQIRPLYRHEHQREFRRLNIQMVILLTPQGLNMTAHTGQMGLGRPLTLGGILRIDRRHIVVQGNLGINHYMLTFRQPNQHIRTLTALVRFERGLTHIFLAFAQPSRLQQPLQH